ncbi:MAG: aspartate--tRNA ligase [Oscillospiraceae bacterium]|nr:aspartate--tRNA ligase [Oscillospiraceae bacterium]
MAETILGLKRTMLCGDITLEDVGKDITLMGWCHHNRDLGGLYFITLRDRSGEIQLVVTPENSAEIREKASRVRSEFVLACIGTVRKRSAPNPLMKTGELEVSVSELRILSEAATPPFYIEENVAANEALRLKYRYLDLRRPDMQRNLVLRHRIAKCARDYFDRNGFLEIETPMLGKSTPEGARDYLVPSRVKNGSFFALPQSPQLYKQLLMLAGYDRYMQITKCFRDEDLRADRQPEFTQIDLEMSFVDSDDVMKISEGFLVEVMNGVMGISIKQPIPRITYAEAMDRFGSDKPDIRFGLEFCDISDIAEQTEFPPFKNALASGGSVRAISVPGGASLSRKEIEAFGEVAKTYRAGGLAWLIPSDPPRGSFLKFLSADNIRDIASVMNAGSEDLILIVSDTNKTVFDALGAVRCEAAAKMGLIDDQAMALLWVTEFPLLEYDEEEGRFVAKHHPFTSPMLEDLELLDRNPAAVRSNAYDIVLNGTELGGGSIRIHDRGLQNKMFALLGFTEEQAAEQFGFLLDAFRYGAPPHGGLAFGLDRIAMLLGGCGSIREVIAFPKVQNSSDLMTEAPAPVSEKQLDELGIDIRKESVDVS